MCYGQPVPVDLEIRRATSRISKHADIYLRRTYYAGNRRNLNAVERSKTSTSDCETSPRKFSHVHAEVDFGACGFWESSSSSVGELWDCLTAFIEVYNQPLKVSIAVTSRCNVLCHLLSKSFMNTMPSQTVSNINIYRAMHRS